MPPMPPSPCLPPVPPLLPFPPVASEPPLDVPPVFLPESPAAPPEAPAPELPPSDPQANATDPVTIRSAPIPESLGAGAARQARVLARLSRAPERNVRGYLSTGAQR